MDNWQHLLDRRNRPAWWVLLVYFLLALIAWYGLRMQAMKNAERQFEMHVRDVTGSIEERLRQNEQILLGGEGMFAASESVDRAEWHIYIERLHLKENYPGIQGVGFIQLVRPADLQAHIAAIRAEGFPDYTVHPPGERPLYAPIIYLEPFSGRNLAAFGYDMMAEATRAQAMRTAAESGKTTISGKVRLMQETHGKEQAGFLMFLPVYRKHQPPAMLEEGWNVLQGFVYSPYRVDDLMAGILGDRISMLDFVIFDGEEETDGARMFVSAGDPVDGKRIASPMMSSVRKIEAYGHTWTVRLHSRHEFEASFQSPLNTVILALGGGISVLLFFLVSFLIFRREHAEEMAKRMTEDIRASKEKLSQSEARIHAILDGADHLIISTDTEGVIQSFNHAAERYLGYRAEEVIGKLALEVFIDADEVLRRAQGLAAEGILVEPGIEVFISRAREDAAGDTREWSYIRKDGSRFPVSLTVTALRDERGEINAFLGIATDITEHRHAEGEWRKLSSAIEQSPVSVVITDADGNIEYVNAKFSEVTGYAISEVIGRNPRILQSGLTPLEVYQSMWQSILGGHQWRGKLQNRKKNGELFWEEIYISAIRDRDGKTTNFVAVKEDITERMKVERMKSEFISTVSHELRTPLTSIRGALALIAGGVMGELPAATKPLVDIAHKNSERLILLVNDILDMEKIEAGKMEFDTHPVKLMPLLEQALDANQAYAEQYNVSYELKSELASDLYGAMVKVDANRMMQVLANLFSNAAKFSPPGDKVIITAKSDGLRVRVAVSNHGSGIPEQFRDRVFQKFAQADSSDTRKKGGTGLGLSITKAIVEQMGGSMGFDSQPDMLTTFFVEFPIWQEAAAVAPAPIDAVGKKRVLICEDDRDIAALLRMMLEQAGLAADIAYNAGQAKQLLAQVSYAAMTLDLALPDQDGIALIRELRDAKLTAALPIVVVSANAIEGRKELGSDAFSVIDWISKPIDQEQLVAVLRQAVKRGVGARPKVLHVEDDPDICQVVNAIVGELAGIDNATSLAEARHLLENNHYDLTILDLSLPDGSGMKLLPLLNGASPPIPVLIFSASEVGREVMHGVKSALVKSRTDNAQLLSTIRRLIEAG